MGMNPFGDHLKELLKGRGTPQQAFADSLGIALSNLSSVITQRNAPPPRTIGKWADALGLKGGPDRELFLDLAAIAHMPEEMQPKFVGYARRAYEEAVTRGRVVAQLSPRFVELTQPGVEVTRESAEELVHEVEAMIAREKALSERLERELDEASQKQALKQQKPKRAG